MVEEIDPFADAVVIDETDDPFADAEIYGSSTEALEGNSNDTLNPTFPTNMWDGWKLEDAEATYQTIITGKNVVKDPYAEQMGEAASFRFHTQEPVRCYLLRRILQLQGCLLVK